jgi:hypothetical protein
MSADNASVLVIPSTIATYCYLIFDRDIAFIANNATFLRQICQDQVLRVNGSRVVERKGKRQVGLRVRMDYDVVEDSLSDVSVIDRIDNLGMEMRYSYCNSLIETYFGFDLPEINGKIVRIIDTGAENEFKSMAAGSELRYVDPQVDGYSILLQLNLKWNVNS